MSDNGLELFDLNAYLASASEESKKLNESSEEIEDTVDEDKLAPANVTGVDDGDQVADEDDMSDELESFCLQCMRMYVNVHLWHLQTGSYAEHEALEDYYESLFELTDGFIESAVANYGAIPCEVSYNLELLPYDEMHHELDSFKEYVEAQKSQIDEEGMVNILDDMLTTTDEVLYKLKNLK